MTTREVHVALQRINIRRHNNFALQASLHGHKMKLKQVDRSVDKKQPEGFTEQEDVLAENALRKAMERRILQQQIRKSGRGRN